MTARRRRGQRGISLVELLVGTGLLVGGGGALLVGMYHGMMFVDYLGDLQVALHATQGKLEELAATDFHTLVVGPEFAAARTPAGLTLCMGEDANCNRTLNAGEVDVNRNGRADQLLTSGRLNVRIKPYPSTTSFQNATMLDVHVAASWRARGRCIAGDDSAGAEALRCNGRMDPGEDADGDGWMDAPVMMSTRVARRDTP